jgi:hypothetical protein
MAATDSPGRNVARSACKAGDVHRCCTDGRSCRTGSVGVRRRSRSHSGRPHAAQGQHRPSPPHPPAETAVDELTLLANSKAAVWTAMLGGKPRSKPRCLIGFWASSGLIVDFANSVIERAGLYAKAGKHPMPSLSVTSLRRPAGRCRPDQVRLTQTVVLPAVERQKCTDDSNVPPLTNRDKGDFGIQKL